MASLRHNGSQTTPPGSTAEDALLDAARESIIDVGWRRSTLTDVARRAGVSRMTIYRRWPDMQTLLADLMTREFAGLGRTLDRPSSAPARRRIARAVAATAGGLRDNELFAQIVRLDPELLLPYLLRRRGRTQDALLSLLERAIEAGQSDGSVRRGSRVLLARSVLLTAYGFALSAPTMTDGLSSRRLDAQLGELVDRYLAP
jgi:AcrR family transcriptional regulator